MTPVILCSIVDPISSRRACVPRAGSCERTLGKQQIDMPSKHEQAPLHRSASDRRCYLRTRLADVLRGAKRRASRANRLRYRTAGADCTRKVTGVPRNGRKHQASGPEAIQRPSPARQTRPSVRVNQWTAGRKDPELEVRRGRAG
jgi:hypothetical protein